MQSSKLVMLGVRTNSGDLMEESCSASACTVLPGHFSSETILVVPEAVVIGRRLATTLVGFGDRLVFAAYHGRGGKGRSAAGRQAGGRTGERRKRGCES